jgi:hypothetical protein
VVSQKANQNDAVKIAKWVMLIMYTIIIPIRTEFDCIGSCHSLLSYGSAVLCI